jgi:hypothetical protein
VRVRLSIVPPGPPATPRHAEHVTAVMTPQVTA